MQGVCTEEERRFLATGDYDILHSAWPGRHTIERIHAAESTLRTALLDALCQRTNGLECPSLPPDFDTGRFVLGKVRPMVSGLFPAKERQVMFDLFEKALVFVTQDNVEPLVLETVSLSAARRIANLFLGSVGLPGLDDQQVILYADNVEKWIPECVEPDRSEWVGALASAVDARNGWKKILEHCSPPRPPRSAVGSSAAGQR